MATSRQTRLAPVTARDGVDTRNKENCGSPVGDAVGDNLSMDMIIDTTVGFWGDIMIGYEKPDYEAVTIEDTDPEQVDFNVWRDMADEPAKYGDEIIEWLELDEAMITSSKRWRVVAYWTNREKDATDDVARQDKQLEELQVQWRIAFAPIAKQAASTAARRRVDRDIKAFVAKIRNAIVTIQSAWRGYAVRRSVRQMDCCMCLAHVHSPLRTDVGYMCVACGDDGPHVELVENDPWNWFRADYDGHACGGCGQMTRNDEDDLRRGYWCSRGCAYN